VLTDDGRELWTSVSGRGPALVLVPDQALPVLPDFLEARG
jgi:hypothetical protein